MSARLNLQQCCNQHKFQGTSQFNIPCWHHYTEKPSVGDHLFGAAVRQVGLLNLLVHRIVASLCGRNNKNVQDSKNVKPKRDVTKQRSITPHATDFDYHTAKSSQRRMWNGKIDDIYTTYRKLENKRWKLTPREVEDDVSSFQSNRRWLKTPSPEPQLFRTKSMKSCTNRHPNFKPNQGTSQSTKSFKPLHPKATRLPTTMVASSTWQQTKSFQKMRTSHLTWLKHGKLW